MEDIEHGRPIQFITERRITEGYEKSKDRWNRSIVQKIGVDNNAET
jgi:hypothetical protein